MAALPAARPTAPAKPSLMAAAAAALPPPPAKPEQARVEQQAKPEPAPFTSGVIQTQPIAAIPGSAEPMKPVRVKTVQVKAGPMKLAAAGPSQPATPITNAIPPARAEVAETSNAVVAKAETTKARDAAAAGQSRHRKRRARRIARRERARPRPHRPWPMPTPRRAPSRRPCSRTAPSSPSPP